MPECKECGDDVDRLVKVKVHGRVEKVCEDCADRLREEAEVAQQSESVIQGMMGYKGRRGSD
jgi:ribosome-binding protein aMBF1 (putative translation factor)